MNEAEENNMRIEHENEEYKTKRARRQEHSYWIFNEVTGFFTAIPLFLDFSGLFCYAYEFFINSAVDKKVFLFMRTVKCQCFIAEREYSVQYSGIVQICSFICALYFFF